MVIGLIVILLFQLFQQNQSPRGEIVFSDFLKKVETGEVREVTLKGNNVSGRLSDGSSFRTFTADYPGPGQVAEGPGREDRRQAPRDQLVAGHRAAVGPDAALHRRLDLLHAADAGRGRQGPVLRQGPGPADLGEAEQGHVPGRGRRGRGQGGAARDHRVPEGPAQVPEARGQDPQGRAPGGPARHRQDPAGQGHRGRGQRAVLLDLRLGLRRDVRGGGRLARARPLRAGQEARALHHLHGRDRRGRPAPGRGPGRRARRARADPEPAPGGDGRLRDQRGRHPHRGHQPARRAGPGAAAARPLRPPGGGGAARREGARGDPQGARAADPARPQGGPEGPRPRHARLLRRGPGQPGERGGAARRRARTRRSSR